MVIRHGLRHAGYAEQWEVAAEISFSREHTMCTGLAREACFCISFVYSAAAPSCQRKLSVIISRHITVIALQILRKV